MLMLYCPQGNIASNVASQDITSSLNFEILPDKCIKSSERNRTKKTGAQRGQNQNVQKKRKKTLAHRERRTATADGNGGRRRRANSSGGQLCGQQRANSSGGQPCGQLIQGGRP